MLEPIARENSKPTGVLAVTADGVKQLVTCGHVACELDHQDAQNLRL